MKVVIIGGVAAGAALATRLRRLDEDLDIIVIEKGPYPSFANCALPYYLGGVVASRDDLFAASPGYLKKVYNLDLRLNTEAVAIDTDEKTVTLKDLGRNDEESVIGYDYLVLATGASAIMPKWAEHSKFVSALKTVPDVDLIKSFIDNGARSALIVGGGAIGIESAENLRAQGLKVTVCTRGEHILSKIDPEITYYAEKELTDHGVVLRTGTTVEQAQELLSGIKITFSNGIEEKFDFVIVAQGVKPNTQIAEEAGIEVDGHGFIEVDNYMRTSDEHVLAVGDIILSCDQSSEINRPALQATPIPQQIRAAAFFITQGEVWEHEYLGDAGAFIVKIFDVAVGCCGMPAGAIMEEDESAAAVVTHSFDHPGFYPSSKRVHAKLIFSREDGRLYGAQAAGDKDAVSKFIDTVATLMATGNDSVDYLASRNHAYAPPVSSQRDVAQIIGSVADNVVQGLFNPICVEDLKEYDDAFKLDVRPQKSFDDLHPAGFVNIPLAKLRESLDMIPRDKRIVISCMVGQSAYVASRILAGHGFKQENIFVLSGSLLSLKAAGARLEGTALN